ncbi:hypothetical protein A3F19_02820 [Candidatus Nomurabacteria bacterium RIFCSPHIGHO2_12_FULL_37_29]|uniref:Cytidyltransferase-like domain-containing protein n=1 Tax=Candidatus Nomurabacteria bacterium RIFCSPHIGHO2_12_FULL_37_29 TaxID=1801759 RepID=A0A1F6WAM5_9BACT|nr:MAG: hypothetical protein A3F19_02820 [Candidatus Nomurabacteria bacterium RIFCSPHIGHO2_12_FULL_37_29]
MKKEIELLKKENKKIGFCYGVFDLLHPGHAKHLEEAKNLCDVLVVGVTSDTQVKKRRKNPDRPIFDERLRAYLICQLKSVDLVFIRNKDTAVGDIKIIRPDLCIKGEDYIDSKDKYLILEAKAAKSAGGKLVFTKTGKFSKIRTTKIIDKIKKTRTL